MKKNLITYSLFLLLSGSFLTNAQSVNYAKDGSFNNVITNVVSHSIDSNEICSLESDNLQKFLADYSNFPSVLVKSLNPTISILQPKRVVISSKTRICTGFNVTLKV